METIKRKLAELAKRKRQIQIEEAFYNGSKIKYRRIGRDEFEEYTQGEPEWQWSHYEYEVMEEQKRIPFDGSDAFDLLGQKFIHKVNLKENINAYDVCISAQETGIYLKSTFCKFAFLAEYYLKWNEILKEWQPCSKVA